MNEDADDPDGLAGEYVLGTLSAAERAAFERRLVVEPAMRALVAEWERRLGTLADTVEAVPPPKEAWAGIERRIGAGGGEVVALRRSRARWRAVAAATGALAAGLALFVARGAGLGAETSFFAVVERGGVLPALVVHVDLGAGVVRVRSLAAQTPPDRSLELWFIGPGGGAPRSMGVLAGERQQVLLPAVARGEGIGGATLAVSLEPPGGSPSGAPTGPVIYSGKLVAE